MIHILVSIASEIVHGFNGARDSRWRALEKRCSTDTLVPEMARKSHTILEIIRWSESWSYAGEERPVSHS
jgi:hypothetical protein